MYKTLLPLWTKDELIVVSNISREFVQRMSNPEWKGCANCLVYDWKQVDPSVLQKCGGCKVLIFLSKYFKRRTNFLDLF